MLPPRDARGSSVLDASLAQRLSLSLGVRVSAAERTQVVPLGAPDSKTRADGESSDSEADSEARPPTDAA